MHLAATTWGGWDSGSLIFALHLITEKILATNLPICNTL